MSRRRSLVGALPRTTGQLILLLCVTSFVLPSLSFAAKRTTLKRTAKPTGKPAAKATPKAAPKKGAAAKRVVSRSTDKVSRKAATKATVKTTSKASSKASSKTTTRTTTKIVRGRRVTMVLNGSRGRALKVARVAPRRVARRAVAVDTGPAPYGTRGTVDEHVHVRKGDTLERIIAVRGIGVSGARRWLSAAEGVYDFRKVRPQRGVTLRFDRATRQLEAVRYEVDDSSLLVLERNGEQIAARVEALPYFHEVRGIAGRIDRGLREDTIDAGVPVPIAAALADIFAWDVNVEDGLEPGDEFRVIYENLWEAGRTEPLTGQIIGAEIVSGGRTLTALLFEDDEGAGYYRPDGQAWSRTYLRYPVAFTEISSGFSEWRMHPVLHRGRPHRGVDLAAPHGTPVRAAANGWVSETGWLGGLGKAVRLQHPDDMSTTYGHLSEVAPGIGEGTSVERGQIIGWVGSTGLATGPHLHYEIAHFGGQMDPMQVNVPMEPSVAEPGRRRFERVRSTVTQQLANLPETDTPVVVTMSSNVYRAE